MTPKSISPLKGLAVLVSGSLHADVKPNPLFTDGAVLQRGQPVPVWGTARDGEKVTVEFASQKITTSAADGKWSLRLEGFGNPRLDHPRLRRGRGRSQSRPLRLGECARCEPFQPARPPRLALPHGCGLKRIVSRASDSQTLCGHPVNTGYRNLIKMVWLNSQLSDGSAPEFW